MMGKWCLDIELSERRTEGEIVVKEGQIQMEGKTKPYLDGLGTWLSHCILYTSGPREGDARSR